MAFLAVLVELDGFHVAPCRLGLMAVSAGQHLFDRLIIEAGAFPELIDLLGIRDIHALFRQMNLVVEPDGAGVGPLGLGAEPGELWMVLSLEARHGLYKVRRVSVLSLQGLVAGGTPAV